MRASARSSQLYPSFKSRRLQELLETLLSKFHGFMQQFLIILRCLHCLVASLPGSPMGKQVSEETQRVVLIWRKHHARNERTRRITTRAALGIVEKVRQMISFQLREVYTKAVYTNNLTDSTEYKECLKLLGFLSKEELLSKLESVVKIVDDSADPTIKSIKSELETRIKTVREASLDAAKASSEFVTVNDKLSRLQLKEVYTKSYSSVVPNFINFFPFAIFST